MSVGKGGSGLDVVLGKGRATHIVVIKEAMVSQAKALCCRS